MKVNCVMYKGEDNGDSKGLGYICKGKYAKRCSKLRRYF